MKRYGLIGRTLGHSHSPAIHALLADYPYALYELEPEAVASFLRRGDIGGLNITIPYKETVLPLCDALSGQAARTGSVNTLVYDADGRITGHNTDYAGFTAMAEGAGVSFAGCKVVLLGDGGTAKTVRQVAADHGAREIVTISRRGPEGYDTLPRHADAQVLVNTTPVGMFPAVDGMPMSLDGFDRLEGVLDVIYNPLRTRLVLDARARGIPAEGGLAMLVYQAAAAATLFTGEAIPPARAEAALRALRASVENIVLVGMPGCGKTSVGRAVAALSGRPFVDTDELLARRFGKPVPCILAQDGEAAFRAAEGEAVAEAAQARGAVIATGGGSVLRSENRTALRQTGWVVHLRRPLQKLPVEGRPLSVDLRTLAAARMPLYRQASDIAIGNDDTIEGAARRVLEAYR